MSRGRRGCSSGQRSGPRQERLWGHSWDSGNGRLLESVAGPWAGPWVRATAVGGALGWALTWLLFDTPALTLPWLGLPLRVELAWSVAGLGLGQGLGLLLSWARRGRWVGVTTGAWALGWASGALLLTVAHTDIGALAFGRLLLLIALDGAVAGLLTAWSVQRCLLGAVAPASTMAPP